MALTPHLFSFLAVACGGALGASARYSINMLAFHFMGPGYPYATMTVNIAGSFLMGALTILLTHEMPQSMGVKLFLLTGFLGAFTTFSAFSLDFVTLMKRDFTQALLYAGLSVVLSIGALMLGMFLTRALTGAS